MIIIVELPALIKARVENGRRLVEVEASCEEVDSEGDVILQKALLESADSFIKSGHLDIDHISELGARLGVPDPLSWIIGRPTEVKNLGNGRTSVVGEISRASDGVHNPRANKFDAFWDSLTASDPPVKWRASIYGFPVSGETVDCRTEACDSHATRYMVKRIDWRSLAFTKNPVNTKIKGYAQIVTAKAFVNMLLGKSLPETPNDVMLGLNGDGGNQSGTPATLDPTSDPTISTSMAGVPGMVYASKMPGNMEELLGQYHYHMMPKCSHVGGGNSMAGFKSHFMGCCGAEEHQADILARALMYEVMRSQKRGR
jgi:hypothetical protein